MSTYLYVKHTHTFQTLGKMPLTDEQVARLVNLYKTPSEPGALRGIKGLQLIAKEGVALSSPYPRS